MLQGKEFVWRAPDDQLDSMDINQFFSMKMHFHVVSFSVEQGWSGCFGSWRLGRKNSRVFWCIHVLGKQAGSWGTGPGAWNPHGILWFVIISFVILLFLGEFIHVALRESSRLERTESNLWPIPSPEHWELHPGVPQTPPGNYFMACLNPNPKKKMPQHQKWCKIRGYKPCYK